MNRAKVSIGLRIAGLVIIGLYVVFMLFFGVGEMAGGDPSGVGHLLPGLLGAGLAFLAWKQPLFGGMVLVGFGLAASVLFSITMIRSQGGFGAASVLGVPFLLSGVLFLAAYAVGPKGEGVG